MLTNKSFFPAWCRRIDWVSCLPGLDGAKLATISPLDLRGGLRAVIVTLSMVGIACPLMNARAGGSDPTDMPFAGVLLKGSTQENHDISGDGPVTGSGPTPVSGTGSTPGSGTGGTPGSGTGGTTGGVGSPIPGGINDGGGGPTIPIGGGAPIPAPVTKPKPFDPITPVVTPMPPLKGQTPTPAPVGTTPPQQGKVTKGGGYTPNDPPYKAYDPYTKRYPDPVIVPAPQPVPSPSPKTLFNTVSYSFDSGRITGRVRLFNIDMSQSYANYDILLAKDNGNSVMQYAVISHSANSTIVTISGYIDYAGNYFAFPKPLNYTFFIQNG